MCMQPVVVKPPSGFFKGRGAGTNEPSRFAAWTREPAEPAETAEPGDPGQDHPWRDGPEAPGDGPASDPAATIVHPTRAVRIVSRNDSPDIPFSQSLNPYQGCEHGCVYCYARPTHAYLGLSPGLDFERQVYAKTNAAELLRRELAQPGYVPEPIAIGANTDPYQPAERTQRLTRALIEVLAEARLPFTLTTKSALVVRDLDLLAPLAADGLVRVFVSLPTLDPALARILEPRAPAPARRLRAIGELTRAGVHVGVFVSPLIPALNDRHLEQVLTAAKEAGAQSASSILLRLPGEVRDLFVQWLQQHFPDRAAHVMSLVRQMREGHDYTARFGARMRGSGVHAQLLAQRFELATRRLGLARKLPPMSVAQFRPPSSPGQLALF